MRKTMIVTGVIVIVVFVAGLFWQPPETPSDVAGWVQAFGSVLAVGLAVWLQYLAVTEIRRQANAVAIAQALHVLASIDALQEVCRDGREADFAHTRQSLIASAGIEVSMSELDPKILALVLAVRDLAIKGYAAGEGVRPADNWQHHDNLYGNLGTDCRRAFAIAEVRAPLKRFLP